MPAAVAVPLIVGGASVGAQVASAKMASGAAKKAAKVQEQAANRAAAAQERASREALALNRDLWQQTSAMYQPYLAYGQGAMNELARGMGMSMPTLGGMSAPSAAAPSVQSPAGPMGGSVQLQAPDGSIRAVPAHQAAHFIQRGARLVGESAAPRAAGAGRTPMAERRALTMGSMRGGY